MATVDDVKQVLGDVLQLDGRIQAMTASTPLLGSIPELDSMAVVHVITALEEHFGITVADDDISAETFSTVGSLADYVDHKLAS